ncbi:MAG: hypothetical protein ACJ8AK_15495 [Gemmatimonadaceae bacterium]
MLANRAWAQTQHGVAVVAINIVLIAMVLTPWRRVCASPDENDQQRVSLPAGPIDVFAGEITYDFDSVLNKTTASYTAPLGKRDFLHRVFFSRPTVHTISASYVFAGRIASRVPDTISVRLDSDEYIDVTSESRFDIAHRTMTLDLGEHSPQHFLSLSQGIEIDSTSRAGHSRRGADARIQDSFRLPEIKEAHVKRRATTWLSTCDFLSLINQREVRGTVADLDFVLYREVVTGLRLFAAQMLPDSARERSVDCSSR